MLSTFYPITEDMTSQGNLFPKIMKTIKKAGIFTIIKIPLNFFKYFQCLLNVPLHNT